jgi:hypothetical protein
MAFPHDENNKFSPIAQEAMVSMQIGTCVLQAMVLNWSNASSCTLSLEGPLLETELCNWEYWLKCNKYICSL